MVSIGENFRRSDNRDPGTARRAGGAQFTLGASNMSGQKTRCTGDCCKAFILNISYDAMWRSRQAKVRHEKYGTPLPEDHVDYQDVDIILPMVRYLGEFTINPIFGRDYGDPVSLYTCKNLRANGDCKIYETRPEMCRTYPEGGLCIYPGCTWSKEDQEAQFAEDRQLATTDLKEPSTIDPVDLSD
jgi:Fe-S-cluster containining protein